MQTWGLNKTQTEVLNRAHRKQLRWVWKDRYKKNKDLYHQSKETPISKDMKCARWRALGHFLRLNEETPCQKAMTYYFETPENNKKYPGRQRTTLPTVINEDIKECAKTHQLPISKFENQEQLIALRHLATDKKKWSELSSVICDIAKDKDRS